MTFSFSYHHVCVYFLESPPKDVLLSIERMNCRSFEELSLFKIKVSWVCIAKSTCLIFALCLNKVKLIEEKWPLKLVSNFWTNPIKILFQNLRMENETPYKYLGEFQIWLQVRHLGVITAWAGPAPWGTSTMHNCTEELANFGHSCFPWKFLASNKIGYFKTILPFDACCCSRCEYCVDDHVILPRPAMMDLKKWRPKLLCCSLIAVDTNNGGTRTGY